MVVALKKTQTAVRLVLHDPILRHRHCLLSTNPKVPTLQAGLEKLGYIVGLASRAQTIEEEEKGEKRGKKQDFH